MASIESKSSVEDETINHLLSELVAGLDLSAVFDKLLGKDLINEETHERLGSLLSNGRTSDAVRETMSKIKRSPPGYLAKLIEVLRSEDRSKHLGDRLEQEYNTRLQKHSAQREASHDLREASHDQPQKHDQTVCDVNGIIDQYVAAIDQHKDKLFEGQRLLSYKIYLIEAGAVTAKEFNDIQKKYKRNKPKMEAIVELLLTERQLKRFIGLSAVMFRYEEVDAEEMFPFIDELGDQHPVKGQLTVKKKRSSPKHVVAATTATDWPQSSPYNFKPLAPPTIPPTSCKYKLLWMTDDFLAVQSVLNDLVPSSSLSPALHTEQITYWETVLFNEIQLYLTYLEAPDKIAQTCVHMMERLRPNIALLSGVCTVSNRIGDVKLGDIVVGEVVIKISSGADVKGERYRAQTKQALSRVISDLKVESERWERNGELLLQRYKSKIPLRPMTYQRLWYTRLYLELNSEAGDRTGWLEVNGWRETEKFSGPSNRTVLRQQMPKLLENFKNDWINKKYWEKDDGKVFPVKPVHSELLRYCERSITIGDTEFPKQHSTDTAIHFASILTTDSNPTADDIDHGNRISNTVMAADLDTFSFYDSVQKYNDCKFFLSIKGVFLMDDGMSDQVDSDYTEYARLASASYALQAVKHLYHKTIIE